MCVGITHHPHNVAFPNIRLAQNICCDIYDCTACVCDIEKEEKCDCGCTLSLRKSDLNVCVNEIMQKLARFVALVSQEVDKAKPHDSSSI